MEAEGRLFWGVWGGEAPPRTSPGVWGAAAPQPILPILPIQPPPWTSQPILIGWGGAQDAPEQLACHK